MLSIPPKGKTTVDKDILVVFEKYRGYGFRFIDIYHTLDEHNMFHHQAQISANLKKLIAEGKVAKVRGKMRFYYGIPEVDKKYLTIKGNFIIREIVKEKRIDLDE